jgi:polyhydroxybutyrate depolymerase
MNKKIVGIFVIMLLIGTVLTVSGKITFFDNEKPVVNLKDNIFVSSNTELKWMISGESLRSLRSYWLHVPPSYDESESVPLVIVLHGTTGFSFFYPFYFFRSCFIEKYTEFSQKADEEGFILLFPNAKFIFEFRVFAFNPGYTPYSYFDNIDDIGFLKDLIDKMINEYNINQSRVYVTGFSNGGYMTYSAGAYLSDIIAAIAPVAGAIGGRDADDEPFYYCPIPDNPVSIIAFHGTNDSLVPYYGSSIDVSVSESISFWVENNGCDLVPDVNISDSGIIEVKKYFNGDAGTEVFLYSTIGGEHWWPGNNMEYNENAPWLYDSNKEVLATDLIWDFFESHPKQ